MKSTLNHRVVYTAIILLAVFFVPLTYAHEFGHLIVCASEGFTFDLDMSILGGSLRCHGTPSNHLLYWSFGGIFAMLVSLAPFLHWKWIRKHNGVIVVCLSFAVGEAFNGLLEGSFHELYMQDFLMVSVLLNLITAITFVGLLIVFARR